MNPFKSIIQGHFTPRSLRIYVVLESLFFYGLIFLCWYQFPAENAFSILTHTFSYLGSFNEDRNPHGWWLFGVAMTGWGLATIPLVRYLGRSLAPYEARHGIIATRLLTAGAIGIILVGLFPDARETLIGPIRWTSMHYVGAVVLVLGFMTGVPWMAWTLRRITRLEQLDGATRRTFQQARWPQRFFLAISSVALIFLTAWVFVYEIRKAAAEEAGLVFGSPWQEAMNTPYSFPLWDNVFVHTLFIYLIWTALTLPPPRDTSE